MRWMALLVLLGACATVPRGPSPEEMRANALDDHCFRVAQMPQADPQERADCMAWLRQRSGDAVAARGVELQAQANRQAQWSGVAAAIDANNQRARQAAPQPVYVAPVPLVPVPVSTTCNRIGDTTFCNSY